MAVIKNNINFGNQNIKRIYKGSSQITQIWKRVNRQNKLLYFYGDGSQGLTYEIVYDDVQKEKTFRKHSISSNVGLVMHGNLVYPANFSLVVTDTDGTVISIDDAVVTTPSGYGVSDPQINGSTITFTIYADAPEISVNAVIKVTYTVRKNIDSTNLAVTGKTSVSITHLDIPRYTFEFGDQNRIGTVKAINNQALAHTDSNKLNGEVSILNDIESIGDNAFLECTGITSVNIGPNIKSIGLAAFACCPSLKTVYWRAENCTEAGSGSYPIFGEYPETEIASMQNTAIAQVTIGLNVKSLPTYAFMKCKSLSTINIPSNVTEVGGGLLESSGITSATIGNGVSNISSYIFSNCSNLQKVKLGSAAKIISEFAFQNCTSLEKITFPSSVTQIQSNAFKGAIDKSDARSTLKIYIEDFGSWCAIDGLSYLMNPYWGSGIVNPNEVVYHDLYWYSDFNKPEDQQIQITSISIPNTVTKIPDHAFYYCTHLNSVQLPNSILFIEVQAFCGCTNLTTINIPEGVSSIGEQAFNGCSKLATLNLPNSLLTIGPAAFWGCMALTSLTIPDNIAELPQHMVAYCTQLESMSIPSGITKIRSNFIYGAMKLNKITYPKTGDEWNAIEKELGWNNGVSGQSDVWIYCSDGTIRIELNKT